MEDFKSKRKNAPRNPYVFLATGIGIGVILTAVTIFLVLGSGEVIAPNPDTASPVPFIVTADPMSMMPTPAPTVVAARVQAAAVSPDGRYLATTATDDTRAAITLTELISDEELTGESAILYELPAGNYYNDLLFSPDGSKLVVTTNEGFALLFDVETRELLADGFPNIGGAAFNADGSLLALVGANNGIRLIDTQSMELVASTAHDAYEVGAVSISSKNQLAIALDNRVEIYEIADLLDEARSDAPDVYEVDSNFAYDIAFHPSGDYLAVSGDGFVQLLYLQDDTRKMFYFNAPQIFALAFSPSGEWLAVAGGESGYGTSLLSVFRWDEGDVIPPDPNFYVPILLEGHEHTIYDVAFTPENYLLSASWDGTVRLWDLNTREEVSRLQH